MIGKAESSNQGQEMILKTLTDGSALATFEKMLKNQNVNAEVAHKLCYGDMDQVLQKAKYSTPVIASCSGLCFFLPNQKPYNKFFRFSIA